MLHCYIHITQEFVRLLIHSSFIINVFKLIRRALEKTCYNSRSKKSPADSYRECSLRFRRVCFFYRFLHQLTVNCWFGTFSGLGFKTGTPKVPNPFHFRGFPGIQTTKRPKPTALTIR